MSDEMSGVDAEEVEEVVQPDEMETLKERAKQMGIKHHPSIGLDKLRDKVNDTLKPKAEDTEPAIKATKVPEIKGAKAKTVLQLKQEHNTRLRKDALRLVRVIVVCMSPNKKDWPGEIFTVSNSIIGTVKKYVPFNTDIGYHIPYIIYEQLISRQYQAFVKTKMANGQTKTTPKMLSEFNVQLLSPLTKTEMGELKTQQALNHSID